MPRGKPNVIFRVQSLEGIGPYTAGLDKFKTPMWNQRANPHPNPYSDEMRGIATHQRCGFESMEQLLDWFGHPDSIRRLTEAGFYVYVIRVPARSVRKGVAQVVYDADEAHSDVLVPWDVVWSTRDKYAEVATQHGIK